jgi:hypothetical protein
MAGRATAMLPTLVSEIALVRDGMGEVPGRRVVHHGLGHLPEGRRHAVYQDENQQETHPPAMLAGNGGRGQGNTALPAPRRGSHRRPHRPPSRHPPVRGQQVPGGVTSS